MPDRHIAVSDVPFFRKLSPEDLLTLMGYTTSKTLEEGDLLFAQGDHSDGLYVLMSGRLTVYVRSEQQGAGRRPVATVNKGQYVGEFGLIDGEPRSAYVEAAMQSEILCLPSKAFELLIRVRPQVAESVIQRFCEMIQEQASISISPELRARVQAMDFPANMDSMRLLCGILRKHNRAVMARGY
jgi:CRP-like cAMP-binding protein